jgi:hypothetical protein
VVGILLNTIRNDIEAVGRADACNHTRTVPSIFFLYFDKNGFLLWCGALLADIPVIPVCGPILSLSCGRDFNTISQPPRGCGRELLSSGGIPSIPPVGSLLIQSLFTFMSFMSCHVASALP